MQTTGIAERPRAIGSTSPFGSLGAVAAMAAAWRCSATSALLGVSGCKATPVVFGGRGRWWCSFYERLLLLALLCGLLIVGYLLGHYDIADLGERLELQSRLGHHVLYFDHARKRRHRRARTRLLVQPVTVPAGEVGHDAARLRDLRSVSDSLQFSRDIGLLDRALLRDRRDLDGASRNLHMLSLQGQIVRFRTSSSQRE